MPLAANPPPIMLGNSVCMSCASSIMRNVIVCNARILFNEFNLHNTKTHFWSVFEKEILLLFFKQFFFSFFFFFLYVRFVLIFLSFFSHNNCTRFSYCLLFCQFIEKYFILLIFCIFLLFQQIIFNLQIFQ